MSVIISKYFICSTQIHHHDTIQNEGLQSKIIPNAINKVFPYSLTIIAFFTSSHVLSLKTKTMSLAYDDRLLPIEFPIFPCWVQSNQ